MHVVFMIFLVLVFRIGPCHGAESADQLQSEQMRAVADFYCARFGGAEALEIYLNQASDDPDAFREVVKQDLLSTFKIEPTVLDAALLNRYLRYETLSMAFLKTGKCTATQEQLLEMWNDNLILIDFRIIPGLILSFRDPLEAQPISEMLMWQPTLLRLFTKVKHKGFAKIAALYLSYVYRSFLVNESPKLRQQFIQHFQQWLLVLRFQAVDEQLIIESIDLAVKVCARSEPAQREVYQSLIMSIIRDCGQRSWQEIYVGSCLQHGLTAVLDAPSGSAP